jgi:hypothetical protein
VPGKTVPFFKPSLTLREALKQAVSNPTVRKDSHRSVGFFSFLYRREPALR